MVGIVVVSHSARLAEGVVELAGQMAGEAPLVAAGGLEDEGVLGTDALRVAAAVEEASQGDGVLVLMDLGSAILSAETALDLLDDERRGSVLLCEAPLVEGAVAAAVAAASGAPLERVAAEARGALEPKQRQLGGGPAPDGADAPAEEQAGEWLTRRVTVRAAHGLHARPAAKLVRTAAGFDADVQVANIASGSGPVPASSLNALATLAVGGGQEIELRARGPQAAAALDALAVVAAEEEPGPAAPAAEPPSAPDAPAGALAGLAAVGGVALGPAVRLVTRTRRPVERPAGTPEEERARLDEALETARTGLREERDAAAARGAQDAAAVLDMHLLHLADEALLGPARAGVQGGASADDAWRAAIEGLAGRYGGLEDAYLRGRAADVEEVGARVLDALAGASTGALPELSAGILVAVDLSAAQTAALDPGVVRGIATARGAPTSHAAIIARALGVPAVVGLGGALLELDDGTPLAIDGDRGLLHVDPSGAVLRELRARAERAAGEARRRRARGGEPAVTRDGVAVEVAANVGSREDARRAREAGADGIGLLRTEFLFQDRGEEPSEAEQAAALVEIAELFGDRPLTVRTLDVGGDKPLRWLRREPEANPFLGLRGIRFGLAHEELLRRQLRATLRAGAGRRLRVMFPMVATLAELRRARSLLDEALAALATEGVAPPRSLEVGLMVEVPSAALRAGPLAGEADFLSLGTNDLAQYTLAAERGNAAVAALVDGLDPTVLSLVGRTARAGARRGAWTGVCGELAGEPAHAALLIGLGVRELSVAPPAVAAVKEAVRETSAREAATLAARAIRSESADAVRALLATEMS